MKRGVCFVLAVSVAIVSGTFTPGEARPIPPQEGLEALRKGFSGISDFSADIIQEKRLALMKRNMTMTGTVRFKKPDLFFMALNPPYYSRMLLKDSVIEMAGGGEGKRNKIMLPPEQGLGRWFSKLTSPSTAIPDGVSIQADLSNALYTLKIAPEGKGQIKELTISFMADGAIRSLILLENNGDRATMTFKNLRRNIGLTDREFRLEP